MNVQPESPWRTLSALSSMWSAKRSIGEVLTPETRAGLLDALETIDRGGLHFYGQRKLPLVGTIFQRPLTPQQALDFVESQGGWFQSDRLTVSHDGEKQFPVWSVHDLQSLHAITGACAMAGISAPALAASIASLEKHGTRLYRYQSSDDGREPLDAFHVFHGKLERISPRLDKKSPIDCDLHEVLALDYLQGSGVDRGLPDAALGAALKSLQDKGFKFFGHVSSNAAGAYTSLSRGREAYAESNGAPFFEVSRDVVLDTEKVEAHAARWQSMYESSLRPLVAEKYLEKHGAGQLLAAAMKCPSPEEAAQQMAVLVRTESRAGNASSWNVADDVKKAHQTACAVAAGPAEHGQVVSDFAALRQTLSAREALALVQGLYTAQRPSGAEDFAAVRQAVLSLSDNYRAIFTSDMYSGVVTDGAADGSTRARAELVTMLGHGLKLPGAHALAAAARDVIATGLPGEAVPTTLGRFTQLFEGLTQNHRAQAIETFGGLQQVIARGEVDPDQAVPRYLQLYTLAADPEVALLRLSAPQASVGEVQQAVREVVINGIRIPKNFQP